MRVTLALALCACAACTHPQPVQPEQPSVQPAPPEPTGRLQAPLMLSWEQRALTGTTASLVAHVKRIAAMNVPMLVRLEVPAGAKLVAGRTQFELAPNAEAVEVTEPVELTFDAVPSGDLVLRVDAEAKAVGFHFSSAYRFGRAEPTPPAAAQPEGPPVKKGERNLGPSVPLK